MSVNKCEKVPEEKEDVNITVEYCNIAKKLILISK